jgi:hypothetical protein
VKSPSAVALTVKGLGYFAIILRLAMLYYHRKESVSIWEQTQISQGKNR